jgi:toluene monooxygenase system ferredoxin subunit
MTLRPASTLDDLWDGDMTGCVLAGRKVLLVRMGEAVYAYEDRCAHLGVALSEGKLEGCVLTCGAHLYQYDVRTGEGVNPKSVRLTSLPVQIVDGTILVELDEGAEP